MKTETTTKGISQTFDRVLGFGRVVASSISEKTGKVFYDLVGLGPDDDENDEQSEVRDENEVYSSLGVVGRPLKPDTDDPDLFAEALTARVSDGLVPFAFHDPRILYWINRGGGTSPREGQTMFAGYGGSFLSFETIDESNGPANVVVLYVPYSRDDSGVPQKAHVITLDPTTGNESIGLVHAEGYAITMLKNQGITMRADSSTFFNMKPGEFTVNSAKIILQGNVAAGASAAAAVPLLAGAASPPSPSVFVSAV